MRPELESNTKTRRYKHLNKEERIQIELLHRQGHSASSIASQLGRSERTIRRELKRGWLIYRTGRWRVQERYNADRAQTVYNASMTGRKKHRIMDPKLASYLYEQIVCKKFSPDVVAAKMRSEGLYFAVCTKTIYNLIDRGHIKGVSNESLWEKRKRKRKHRYLRRERKRPLPPGLGIQDRPIEADERSEVGHWEIDLVCSGITTKDPSALLTLVERKSRRVIIRKLSNKSQYCVQRALNGLERKMGAKAFRECFKSITADNGSEFLDHKSLATSVFTGERTRIYYTHPYSSWERGSNENANRMIRRFIPKGDSIARYSRSKIKWIEQWLNNYPRKVLNYMTAAELFSREIEV